MLKDSELAETKFEDYLEVINGQLVMNSEKVAKLGNSAAAKALKDFVSDYANAFSQLKEIEDNRQSDKEELLNSTIEAENYFLDLYKEQLEKQRDALKESLEDRLELYQKYFDQIDAEAETDTYEDDRAALLNTIARLSSATDATSLSKLKEAQSSLKSLDEERNASLRETRRSAVEAEFEDQQDKIDKYYNEMLENEQDMLKQLKDSNRLLDDLLKVQKEGKSQAQQIQLTLDYNKMKYIFEGNSNLSFDEKGNAIPANAEGGLVDYTGLAWVDGTKTKPEAFLDAEDTLNISKLASALRVFGSNIDLGTVNQPSSASSITTGDINIALNGSGSTRQDAQNLLDVLTEEISKYGYIINSR